MKRGKKGVSPVIATVLLIGMVMVIGLIVFMWFRGFIEETVTKFDGQNIKLVCTDVQFDVSSSGSSVFISNIGNVPIYDMMIKISGGGSYETIGIKELAENEWPTTGLGQGGAFASALNYDSYISNTERLTLIPVLIGISDKGKRTYTCEEQYGYEVII